LIRGAFELYAERGLEQPGTLFAQQHQAAAGVHVVQQCQAEIGGQLGGVGDDHDGKLAEPRQQLVFRENIHRVMQLQQREERALGIVPAGGTAESGAVSLIPVRFRRRQQSHLRDARAAEADGLACAAEVSHFARGVDDDLRNLAGPRGIVVDAPPAALHDRRCRFLLQLRGAFQALFVASSGEFVGESWLRKSA
jgi:hypothetical protein